MRSWFREGGEWATLQTGESFIGGGREGGGQGEAEWRIHGRGVGEEGLTFRTLPESVGFHAEGGAETFFIV